jgi:hypothetical protein
VGEFVPEPDFEDEEDEDGRDGAYEEEGFEAVRML